MKILRVRLASFRGVTEREVELLPTGVTVIRGPNEVGKSTLAEAIDLLFDVRADSQARRVKEVQPVGQDVGSEVEVEATAGTLHFVYRKRFNRDTEARLQVLAPKVETLVGREAHDRALELLEESVDLTLWRALRVQQGASLAMAEVHGASSLAAALDRAARVESRPSDQGVGDEGAGAPEETLFARVQREHERYYTPGKGQERAELKNARAAVSGLKRELERLEGQLAELETELEELARLEGSTGQLREAASRAEQEAAKHADALARLEMLIAQIEILRRRARESAEREKGWRELARLRGERDEAARRAAEAEERVEGARAALEPFEERALAAAEGADSARELLELRRRDERHGALVDEAGRLRATVSRASEAANRVAELSERVARLWIDDAGVARIEESERALAAAEGALAAGSPTVRLKALAPLEVDLQGRRRRLAAGESLEERPAELLRLRVGELAQIEVEPGGGAAELRRARGQRKLELERRCAEAGVASAEEARALSAQRRQAVLELEAAREALARALEGQEAEQVAARLAELEAEIEAYRGGRRSEPPPPESTEAALGLRAQAEQALDEARGLAEERQRELAEERRKGEELKLTLREARGAVERVEEQMGWTRGQLTAQEDNGLEVDPAVPGPVDPDREGASSAAEEGGPEALAARAEAAARASAAARAEAREAEHRMAELQPEMVRVLAERSRESLRNKRAELTGTERRLHGLAERLRALGEQGLQEARDETARRLAAGQRERDDLARRAAAAGELHRVMAAARSAARAAYLGPLQGLVEELGRKVYGEGFQVELDEQLRVTRRILDGVALPVEALSAGAREQLSILFRLACASLVSADGGVPLILDDSLGHSDPKRMKAMARVLAAVGESCQVVVLTSWPERFAAVEAARFLDFD